MRLKAQRFHFHAEDAAARRHLFKPYLPPLDYAALESGIRQGMTTRQLAERHQCSQSRIVKTLRKHGLATQHAAQRRRREIARGSAA